MFQILIKFRPATKHFLIGNINKNDICKWYWYLMACHKELYHMMR